MANWAQNQIYFTGEESKVKEITELFIQMAKKGEETNEGQIPDFMKEPKQDWFFNIYAYENYEQISYETKYSPNIEDCIEITKHFEVNFELNYQESGCCIFGKAIYTAGNEEAEILDLKREDFDKYSHNEETDIYTYNGKEYECYDEMLENIFKDKFNQSY